PPAGTSPRSSPPPRPSSSLAPPRKGSLPRYPARGQALANRALRPLVRDPEQRDGAIPTPAHPSVGTLLSAGVDSGFRLASTSAGCGSLHHRRLPCKGTHSAAPGKARAAKHLARVHHSWCSPPPLVHSQLCSSATRARPGKLPLGELPQ